MPVIDSFELSSVHVVWNAAAGYDRLLKQGFDATPYRGVTAAEIHTTLAAQQRVLFRLVGIAAFVSMGGRRQQQEVVLKIEDGSTDESLHVSCEEPPFNSTFRVIEDPKPSITRDGDYVFDLHPLEPTVVAAADLDSVDVDPSDYSDLAHLVNSVADW